MPALSWRYLVTEGKSLSAIALGWGGCMKCPSCGYENRENAQYCNLCQVSFVGGPSVREPSAPYGLALSLGPKKEAAQAARKVSGSQAGGESWYRRHLNWTWVLAQLAVGLIGFFILTVSASGLFLGSTTLPSEESLFASFSVIQVIVLVLQLIAVFGVGAWVLKRKKRGLVWLLMFLVPFGWIVILCLKNRSQPPALLVSSRSSGSIHPGLASQGLGTRSDKYWP
jgi:hypothetical protein